ncbi:MAG TPA: hypothetical protein VND80_05955 [Steroidobacteraceae bacterium]|nr:hypothetical protein [Steroidobacteraceae bacterium]
MFDLFRDATSGKSGGGLGKKSLDAARAATDATARIVKLEQRYDQLRLISMAMWNLLKDRLQLTDADLATHVEALRAQAAAAEHDRNPELIECTKCKRKIPAKSATCLYCGATTASAGTFKAT